MPIGTLIKIIQDIMRKDVGVDGDAQRISQMVWLLFLKIFDDKEKEWQVTIEGYKSPLQSRFQWSNWAADPEGMTGDELIDFVNNGLFPALKKLATSAGVSAHGKVLGGVFEDAYNYMKSGTLLRQVINTIQSDVDFNVQSDRHIFNDIYEKILADLQSAGNAGEYYTPRALTQFMVDIIDPKLGESILDPACGTGGFLTCAIEHLRKQEKTSEDRLTIQNCIHGVEKKPLPHMLAVTNMMLHGIDLPTNILHDNTLSRPLKDYGPKDRVDIVVTNPPFGGMEEDGIENNFPRKYKTRETADLFLALIMHRLKHDTGRAAIILPDGFLFGEGVKTTIKRELLTEFNLHTVIRMPKGVFSPYTSINTNILFFEKGERTKHVWFFEHPYPEGYKSYSRTNPLTIQEFDLEKAWWNNRKENQYAWKVSFKDIEARNFNLDIKNPHEEEVVHDDPEQLMKDCHLIMNDIEVIQAEIKSQLKHALTEKQSSNSFINENSYSLELFFEQFNTLFSVIENVELLKKTVLSLAMKGKLVSQDINDTPVSDLLCNISSLKKESHLLNSVQYNTYERNKKTDFILTQIPDTWKWIRLDEYADLIMGQSPQSSSYNYNEEGLPFFQGKADFRYLYPRVSTWCTSPQKIAPPNSILISVRAPVGPTNICPFEACIGRGLAAINCLAGADNMYLMYYLRSIEGVIASFGTGSTFKAITKKVLQSILVPVPPQEEQKRIVAKLEYLLALCDELMNSLHKKTGKQTDLTRAVLNEVEKP